MFYIKNTKKLTHKLNQTQQNQLAKWDRDDSEEERCLYFPVVLRTSFAWNIFTLNHSLQYQSIVYYKLFCL